MPNPVAGWYDDPDGSGGERWWDGAAWTASRRTNNQEPMPPSSVESTASSATPVVNTVSGWYPDPELTGVQRWWDGQGWTDQRRNPPLATSRPEPVLPPLSIGQPPINGQLGKYPRPDQGNNKKILIAIGVAAAVGVLAIATNWFGIGKESRNDTAKARCRTSVLNQLASPSTTEFLNDTMILPSGLNSFEMVDVIVDFPKLDESLISDVIQVSESFDTQNRFGAKVRGSYTCKAVFTNSFLTTVTNVKVR